MFDTKLAYLVLDATSWFMTGLIWFVQIVHYPLFAKVGTEESRDYALIHCNLTGTVVVVPMLIQALLALGLALFSDSRSVLLLWLNLVLVAIIWCITALYSVPSHKSLCANGFTSAAHQTLLRANWVRTILWTACSIILTIVLYRMS